ncbi:MAG: hypothetical protein JW791_01085 [Nanoarchaeota archaeon]|nr:hypothetical protein [Nanoarchaeota archaeon]
MSSASGMINNKSQAGIEIIIMLVIVLIASVFITQTSYFKQYAANNLYSNYNSRLYCEELASLVSKSFQASGFSSRFYNFRNMTIDSDNNLVTVYYKDKVLFCSLPPGIVSNTNITAGDVIVYNNGTSVAVMNS